MSGVRRGEVILDTATGVSVILCLLLSLILMASQPGLCCWMAVLKGILMAFWQTRYN